MAETNVHILTSDRDDRFIQKVAGVFPVAYLLESLDTDLALRVTTEVSKEKIPPGARTIPSLFQLRRDHYVGEVVLDESKLVSPQDPTIVLVKGLISHESVAKKYSNAMIAAYADSDVERLLLKSVFQNTFIFKFDYNRRKKPGTRDPERRKVEEFNAQLRAFKYIAYEDIWGILNNSGWSGILTYQD